MESENIEIVETLESEIKRFTEDLSYWGKFLAEKILSDNVISDSDIDTAYSYLLEDLILSPITTKPEIAINYNGINSGNYKPNLLLTKLENVEGVNALTENQVIEFNPNVTIIYGSNGSGKSGYVRLMKKAFYSKAPEEIIPNIHILSGHKPTTASFTFNSEGSDVHLLYPTNSSNSEFEQFAVFDNGSVKLQLENRNEFEFRPTGLGFFADYTEAIKRVEVKLNTEIVSKQQGYTLSDLISLFDGESDIKTLIQSLSAQTKIDDLKKHTPFSMKDRTDKEEIEKKYDELLLASRNKEKEIQKLEGIEKLVNDNKSTIEAINTYFTTEYLTYIETSIADCVKKEATAKAEGIENFKTDKIQNIGTPEWKNFIVAAEQFAKKQKIGNVVYPENNDNCLLCQQPLSEDAQKLITNYWKFIKSVAEQNVKQALNVLTELKSGFEKLPFDLFPANNTLTLWLNEYYPQVLTSLKQKLSDQKILAANIVSDLTTKTVNKRAKTITSVKDHDIIISVINESIKLLREEEQSAEFNKLLKAKTTLLHKEKLNTHFPKFETYIGNQQWIVKAHCISWMTAKRNITDWEKYLSGKYFNQKYIDTFNQECIHLNGNFGIDINHTGSGGTSYRQLTLKGKNPTAILSEGEQNIIALADFLAEMQVSEINRGIIFDDPVTSLDENHKSEIAERLVKESLIKQVIIFTHDLVFVSSIVSSCDEKKINFDCHWIEKLDNKPGIVWLKNSPSFEKLYKKSGKAQEYYSEAKNLGPEQREDKLKNGFAALRTSYESLVVFDLFKGVVQRFNERISVDSLSNVFFTTEIKDELLDSFYQCCRYMEGHSHSDKYSYKKPQLENLNEEILRFITIKKKISELNKNSE